MSNSIGRNFTQEELSCIGSHSTFTNRNIGNLMSNNNYILNEPEMVNLKKFVTDQLGEYVEQVYKPISPVEIFVTQSWINWTKKGEYHHKHAHPNSFLSGVFYMSTDPATDTITFWCTEYKQLQLKPKTFDIFNADSWSFSVKQGDIIIFPSSLTHSVNDVVSENVRISIAFNSFIKGAFGSKELLTYVGE